MTATEAGQRRLRGRVATSRERGRLWGLETGTESPSASVSPAGLLQAPASGTTRGACAVLSPGFAVCYGGRGGLTRVNVNNGFMGKTYFPKISVKIRVAMHILSATLT